MAIARNKTTALAALAASLVLARPAAAGPAAGKPSIEIKQWRLENGLQVVYSPHHRVPAVTVQVWYHAGSKDERPGIRGVAHMFEHMMFKGSKRVRPEAHARMLSAIGGTVNAFTTQDLTAYHDTLPKQYLGFAMKLEAERMRNLLLTDKTIKSEREVVKEEKRARLENSPIGRALEAIHELSFTKHPYSWTPAGDIPDLNRVTRADCQAFYDTYYVPNNATLVVVGDVSEAQVRAAAQAHFGSIPRGKEPPRVTIVEPPQRAPRKQLADWPSQLAVVLDGYHVPPAAHPDLPALEVLSAILSAGRSSRMHQALVRKSSKALQAGGSIWPREQPGLMFLYGIGLPSHDVNAMRSALLAEIKRLVEQGVTEAELRKAKNQIATGQLRQLRTIGGIAYQIGNSTYTLGSPGAFLEMVPKIDRVSAADVKRVAQTYLSPAHANTVLVPPQGAVAPAAPAKGGAQ